MSEFKGQILRNVGLAVLIFLILLAVLLYTSGTTASSNCALNYPSPTTTFYASSSSPLVVCAKLYYFGGNTASVNPASVVQVLAFHSNGTQDDVTSDFGVLSTPTSVSIGGPTNESEGVQVVITILPHGGFQGTFALGFGYLFEGAAVVNCPAYSIQIGNNPNPYLSTRAMCPPLAIPRNTVLVDLISG
jgi:hypothetical protein